MEATNKNMKEDVEKGDDEETEAVLQTSEGKHNAIQARRLSMGNVGMRNLSSYLRKNSVEATKELANTITTGSSINRKLSIFQQPQDRVRFSPKKWKKSALALVSDPNPITLSVSALALTLVAYFSFSEVLSILVDLVAAVYLEPLVT